MGRSTVHYADNETNNILKRLHNKLRPAGTPVERVEYIIELLLLRIFETQHQIVEKLDKQMAALESVRFLKAEAEKRIEEILAGMWKEKIF